MSITPAEKIKIKYWGNESPLVIVGIIVVAKIIATNIIAAG